MWKGSSIRAGLAAASLACVGCASAGSPIEIRTQIRQLDAEWSRAAERRDVDRVVSFWAEDAVVFPPGSPPVAGRAAIYEYVTRSFQTPGFRISWKTTTVTASPGADFAYATGTNRVAFRGPDGREMTVEGKAVTIWRREKGGAWKCVIDIWNDMPRPAQ